MVDKALIQNTINYDNLIKQFCFYGRLNKAVDLLNITLKRGNLLVMILLSVIFVLDCGAYFGLTTSGMSRHSLCMPRHVSHSPEFQRAACRDIKGMLRYVLH